PKETIKQILDLYIVDLENSLRELITLSDSVPNEIVNCEEEVKQLIKNLEYIYNLINDINQYPEPLKILTFSTAVGTA
ncbi:13137_t:CDS:2, partial [Racocetra fulgida]